MDITTLAAAMKYTKDSLIGKGAIQGQKGDKGDKGDAFTYEDFTPEQLAALQGPQGEKGDKGDKGDQGNQGERGPAFTYEDFTPQQLELLTGPQGKQGEQGPQGPQGIQGEPGNNGKDGVSPLASIEQNENGATITVIDGNGTTTANVLNGVDGNDGSDGITPNIIVTTIDGGHNLSFFYGAEDSRNTNFDVLNGSDGINGTNGINGINGTDGETPNIIITAITGGHNIAFSYGEDDPRNSNFDILDGVKGDTGTKGDTGDSGADGITPLVSITSIVGGHNVAFDYGAGDSRNMDFNVSDGLQGPQGDAGYTPIKGTDYFTAADKAEITNPINTRITNMATFANDTFVIDIDSEVREPSTIESLTARLNTAEAKIEELESIISQLVTISGENILFNLED